MSRINVALRLARRGGAAQAIVDRGAEAILRHGDDAMPRGPSASSWRRWL